jgi:DNA polymerase III delta prime subunit
MLNAKTERLLQSFARKPTSTLLLESGIAEDARFATAFLTKELLTSLRGNVLSVSPDDKGTISIDMVRDVKNKLATIAGRENAITRAVTIYNSECLTIEAQNALLKLIEEPGENTLIILSVSSKELLQSTIISRSQIIRILPISKAQATRYCKENSISEELCNKAYVFSKGSFSLFQSYINGDFSDTTLVKAKELLQKSPFERER